MLRRRTGSRRRRRRSHLHFMVFPCQHSGDGSDWSVLGRSILMHTPHFYFDSCVLDTFKSAFEPVKMLHLMYRAMNTERERERRWGPPCWSSSLINERSLRARLSGTGSELGRIFSFSLASLAVEKLLPPSSDCNMSRAWEGCKRKRV